MKYFIGFSAIFFIMYLVFFLIDWKKTEPFKFMNKNHTTLLKGFAILTVVWAHIGAQLGVGNIQFIAGSGVAIFLICSGYGLMVSYQKNGLKDFWRKKLLKVVAPFWIVELLGLIAVKKLDFLTYLKDAFFIVPATAYGWFMQYIIICYMIFWLAVKSAERFKLSKGQSIGLTFSLFAIWFILDSLFFANPLMPFLKARQMLSFPLGVVIAQYYEQIENSINKEKFAIVLTSVGLCMGVGGDTIDSITSD